MGVSLWLVRRGAARRGGPAAWNMMKRPRTGRSLQICALLLLVGLWSAGAVSCTRDMGSRRTADLPDFPEYAPAKPFLENQERTRIRARAVRELRRRKREESLARSRAEAATEWQPVYDRIKTEQELRNDGVRERERLDFQARGQAATNAEWQPVYDRIAAARFAKPLEVRGVMARRRQPSRFPSGTRLAAPGGRVRRVR